MINSDFQQESARRLASEIIDVPDMPDPVTFDEDVAGIGAVDDLDIESIMHIIELHGVEQLTDREREHLAKFEAKMAASVDHYANLAEVMDERELTKIGADVLDWVRWDDQSRQEWYEIEKKGIRALGVSPNVDGGASFDGSSDAVHPLLAEAVVQFNARSLGQMWPAGGPVKTIIKGQPTKEVEAQSRRVGDFMNYQYTEEMPGAFEQTDALLLRLPLSGSVFTKTYYDPIRGICRDKIDPADFIVPYRADSLKTAPRYSERIMRHPNELRRYQLAGMYRDIKLPRPFEDGGEQQHDDVKDEIKATEGMDKTSQDADDQRHTLYECSCFLDLKGFEHLDENGKETGLALPYIVTVDRDSQKVLAIYRGWREEDTTRYERIVFHNHYRYTPGLGFYGYGLYHWIGGLSRAATGALRALLDAAQFANMPGGFRAKDASMPNGKITIAPGEWKEIDCTAEDLSKAFFSPPYKEPSATLFSLMGALEDLSRRFASTTDSMVGEGTQNTPVGTILARIEQGSKIYTAIQQRCHESAKEEFKLVAYLNSIWLPDEYPYSVEGEDRSVLRSDFDSRIDVIPVSDPNAVSGTQQYLMASATLEMAREQPGLYNMIEVHRRVLRALKIQDIDELLLDQSDVKRMDPVTENAVAGVGQPIKAFVDQDHQSHIIVHQAALSQLESSDPAAAVIMSHVREHMAHQYMLMMAQSTGLPLQMPDLENLEDIPPEMDLIIAQQAAQAAQQMMQEQQAKAEQEAAAAAAEEQAAIDAAAEAEILRKDRATEADIQRKDRVASADIERKDAETAAEIGRRVAEDSVKGDLKTGGDGDGENHW